MQPTITLNYELTHEDYIEFNVYHVAHSEIMRRSLILIRFGVPILLVFIPFLLAKLTVIPFRYWMITLSIAALIHIWSYPKYADKTLRKKISKMLKEGKSKSLLGQMKMTISENGIWNVYAHTESKSSWDVVERIVVTTKYVYIYIGSVAAYIVPFRAFSVAEEKSQFIDALTNFAVAPENSTE